MNPLTLRQSLTRSSLIFLLYFGSILSARSAINGPTSLANFSSIHFLLGGLFGTLTPFFDRLIYVVWTDPASPLSRQVRHHLSHLHLISAITTLHSGSLQQIKLTTTNLLFLAVWVILASYLRLYSFLPLSQGLLLGCGLGIIITFANLIPNRAYITSLLFWPFNLPLRWPEAKLTLIVFTGIFILITLTSI